MNNINTGIKRNYYVIKIISIVTRMATKCVTFF